MRTKIYCLKDKNNNIRYIGKTSQSLKERLRCHIKDCNNIKNKYHRANWIRKCIADGYLPIIELICEVSGHGNEIEKLIINLCRDFKINLTNSTDGGEGLANYKHSEETIKKLKKSLKGRKVWNKGLVGYYKHSAKSKAKMGRKGKLHPNFGKQASSRTKIKQRKAKLGTKQSFYTRLKRSQTAGGKQFMCLNNNKKYYFTNDAAKELNICQGNISACLRNKRKSTNGYKFQYVNAKDKPKDFGNDKGNSK